MNQYYGGQRRVIVEKEVAHLRQHLLQDLHHLAQLRFALTLNRPSCRLQDSTTAQRHALRPLIQVLSSCRAG